MKFFYLRLEVYYIMVNCDENYVVCELIYIFVVDVLQVVIDMILKVYIGNDLIVIFVVVYG